MLAVLAVAGTVIWTLISPLSSGVTITVSKRGTPKVMVTMPPIPGSHPLPVTVSVSPL